MAAIEAQVEGMEAEALKEETLLRLKFHYKREIRVVAVDRSHGMSFRALKQRLTNDYGFELTLAYFDLDGDLICLASQNDVNELLRATQTVNVRVSRVGEDEPPAPTRDVIAGPTPSTSAATLDPLHAHPVERAEQRRSEHHRRTLGPIVHKSDHGSDDELRAAVVDTPVAPTTTITTTTDEDPSQQQQQQQPTDNNNNNNNYSATTNKSARQQQASGGPSLCVPQAPQMQMQQIPIHSIHAMTHEMLYPPYRERTIRWQRGDMIGQGAFGRVYMALNLDTGELMAMKQLDSAAVSSRERAALENEIAMMRGLSHPNIVRYLGVDIAKDLFAIFLEYVPGGSLRSLLDRFGKLEEAIVRLYSRQILFGLEYLHANAIAHRDIKAANVLVSNDGSVKLADFGASKRIATPGRVVVATGGGAKGTPLWMAPEVIKETPKAQGWRKADVWSVGCTVIEMATGKPPWSQYSNPVTAMYHIACVEELPEMPVELSEDGHQFLILCFERDPKHRPEVSSLLLEPFAAVAPTAWRENRAYDDATTLVLVRPSLSTSGARHENLYPSRPSTTQGSEGGLSVRRSASLRVATDPASLEQRRMSSDIETRRTPSKNQRFVLPSTTPSTTPNSTSAAAYCGVSPTSIETLPPGTSSRRHTYHGPPSRGVLPPTPAITPSAQSNNGATSPSVASPAQKLPSTPPRKVCENNDDESTVPEEERKKNRRFAKPHNLRTLTVQRKDPKKPLPAFGDREKLSKKSSRVRRRRRITTTGKQRVAPMELRIPPLATESDAPTVSFFDASPLRRDRSHHRKAHHRTTTKLASKATRKTSRKDENGQPEEEECTENSEVMSPQRRSNNDGVSDVDLDDSDIGQRPSLHPEYIYDDDTTFHETDAARSPAAPESSVDTVELTFQQPSPLSPPSDLGTQPESVDYGAEFEDDWDDDDTLVGTHPRDEPEDQDDIKKEELRIEERLVLEHGTGLTCLGAAKRAPLVAVGTNDGTVYVVDAGDAGVAGSLKHDDDDDTKKTTRKQPQQHEGVVGAVAVGPHRLVTGYDHRGYVWNPGTMSVVHNLQGHEGRINRIVLVDGRGSQDDNTKRPGSGNAHLADCILTAAADHTVRLWDVRMRRPQAMALRGHTDSVTCLELDLDHSSIWTASRDTSIRAWDLRSGRCRFHLTQHFGSVKCLVADPTLDGHRGGFLSGARDTSIHIWATGGTCVRALRTQRGFVNDIAVQHTSPRARIAAAGTNGKIRIWDHHQGKCLRNLIGHTHAVNCVKWSGDVLVSGGTDATVRIWRPQSQMAPLARTLKSHKGPVVAIHLDDSSPTTSIFSASTDGSLRVTRLGSY